MNNFPFLNTTQALLLLRIATAIIFFAHAAVRVFNGTVVQFGGFLNSKGLVVGVPIVWGITAFEIIGSIMLALGYYKKVLSAGFIFILLVGIILIHASLGWFVGEHGSGGCEYSFILIAALIAIAADEN